MNCYTVLLAVFNVRKMGLAADWFSGVGSSCSESRDGRSSPAGWFASDGV